MLTGEENNSSHRHRCDCGAMLSLDDIPTPLWEYLIGPFAGAKAVCNLAACSKVWRGTVFRILMSSISIIVFSSRLVAVRLHSNEVLWQELCAGLWRGSVLGREHRPAMSSRGHTAQSPDSILLDGGSAKSDLNTNPFFGPWSICRASKVLTISRSFFF